MQVYKLGRILYSPLHCCQVCGFISGMLAEDGNTLDVLVSIEQSTFTACVMKIRPGGVLIMEDDKGLEHKLSGVPDV